MSNLSIFNIRYWQRTLSNTSYRDATASDVVTDETERSMNWKQTQQSTVTMVCDTIHYYRWMIDDSWLIIDYGAFRLTPIVVTTCESDSVTFLHNDDDNDDALLFCWYTERQWRWHRLLINSSRWWIAVVGSNFGYISRRRPAIVVTDDISNSSTGTTTNWNVQYRGTIEAFLFRTIGTRQN